jgi:hypothetical protein
MTDLLENCPGDTAWITASNNADEGVDFDFAAGETVMSQVTRTDGIPDIPDGNLPR